MKSKKVSHLISLSFLLLIHSCSQKEKNLVLINNLSLTEENCSIILEGNKMIIDVLKNNNTNYKEYNISKKQFDMAREVDDIVTETIKLIKSFENLSSESGKASLQSLLTSYYIRVSKVDQTFEGQFNYRNNKIQSIIEKFYSNKYENISYNDTYNLVNLLVNDIVVSERNYLVHCQEILSNKDRNYYQTDEYQSIFSVNKLQFKQNEEIEIKAGIGYFTKLGLPSVTINGETISLGLDGAAFYKSKVNATKGMHSIKIILSYKKQDGTSVNVEKEIEYIVN